jgi:hypothetical protein
VLPPSEAPYPPLLGIVAGKWQVSWASPTACSNSSCFESFKARRSAALALAVEADQHALDIDLNSYNHGLLTYITVLTQQLQTVQARQQFAQAMLTQSTDLVKLYKALGGGWESAPNAAAN